MIESQKTELSTKEINELLKTYHNLTNILESIVDKRVLYNKEFIKSLDNSLDKVAQNQTTTITNFSNFIS